MITKTFEVRRSRQTVVNGTYHLTDHGWRQMTRRRISPSDVELVLNHGTVRFIRGARVFALMRRDLARLPGVSGSAFRLVGKQTITTHEGVIMTVFKNPNGSSLRPRSRRRGRRKRGRLQPPPQHPGSTGGSERRDG